MSKLHALIPIRIVAAFFAVAMLIATPAVEAAQCADVMSEVACSVQMLDVDGDESPQKDSPEQQGCAHWHCHHAFTEVKSKPQTDAVGRPIMIAPHAADELIGDVSSLLKRPPRA